MSLQGRRPIAGMERTPSGAISRSKTSIAKRAEKIRETAKAQAQREQRLGRSLQERTQQARAAHYGIPPHQAASHHVSTVEGRLYLKGTITNVELLAIEHYKRTLARFGRDAGSPTVTMNTLAKYLPTEPRAVAAPASGAAASLSKEHYDKAEAVIMAIGRKASWATSLVCRRGLDLPDRYVPFFIAAVRALVAHYRLGPDPDRDQARAA